MSEQKERIASLANLSARTSRKNRGFDDVKIKTFDKLDESTGELIATAQATYDPDKYKVSRRVNKENIKQKAPEPFVRIDRTATDELANNEKLVYYLLTELIRWEDNFIRNADGTLMSISQFAKLNGFSRSHVNKMLSALEVKKRIKIVDGGNVKGIYLYSKYVWFGFEKNRNDSKLTTLSQLDLTRAFSHDTVVSNIKKESGVLGDSDDTPLISQSTMTDLSEINDDTDSAADYTGARDLIGLLPDSVQERVLKMHRFDLLLGDSYEE